MDVFLKGSAKKPLRLIIVLVIIAMCLSMADGGAIRHKNRHAHGQKRLNAPRAHGCQKRLNASRPRQPNEPVIKLAQIGTRMHRIQVRLTNTLAKFFVEQNSVNETRRKPTVRPPDWLPKVNFFEISRKNNGGAIERFELLVPKLYKNLKSYQVLFDCLHKVNADFIDSSEPEDRKRVIRMHQHQLLGLVQLVEDGMTEFHRCIPENIKGVCNAEDIRKHGFEMEPSQTQRIEQDALAYRAYTKTLKNWKRAFRCGLPSLKDKVFCKKWKQQFEDRRREKMQ